ncbi:VirK/YbjX family protein [Lelliottia sp. CFBP8978]|uniref:VirK/YbjX family protein n=1 Tax=Lelliottia sp. CFBP8978 TaxID=3096522 RepID=UPI002A6A2145|nr:VirK/YbjX family protein [Lelliottia sp. CFBP8978]MDY1038217.1 VirK/YbjX family protein [Lelliottia sp. CFBP8978]
MSNTSLQIDIPEVQPANIISALTHGQLIPGPIWTKRDYRIKFFLRSLLFWSSTKRMLSALAHRADFDKLLAAQITLPSKTHRQYLTRGLSANQRAEAIVHHYEWLDALPDRSLVNALTHPVAQPVVHFQAKDGAQYNVYASSASKAEREGESTLWLRDEEDTLLTSLTFSVVPQGEHSALVIGGLQGPRRGVTRETIKKATRACYGLFPKRVLMEVIFHLAARSDIKAIYGVSDEGHVFRALRYRLSKGRHFHASYDEFWASVEGKKLSAFRWELPLQMERKSLESIASKKRAEYRRRFGLLDEIAEGINARF